MNIVSSTTKYYKGGILHYCFLFQFKHLIMNLDPDESDDDDNNTNNPSKGHVHTRNSGGVEPHPLRGSTPSVEDRISEQSSIPPPAVSISLETEVDNTAVYQIVVHLMNRIIPSC